MAQDLSFEDATTLAQMIRRRELSSRELLDHLLRCVDERNPSLNAVVTLDVDRARSRADAVDAALGSDAPTGALLGVPMTIKDCLETKDLRTTAGAPELSHHVPTEDAVAVGRLREAGAIPFGKTNVPIYAADGQSYNDLFGTSNNPWDRSRTPGGSSGGAAAAVAAGLSPLELGSDIAGSIRNPSCWCGLFGHKPTHGIIPTRGHIPGRPGELAERDLNVVGPIARSARDLRLGLEVLAGPLPDASAAWQLRLPPPRRERLQDYRVAAWLDDDALPVDREVGSVLESAVQRLEGAGVAVDTTARPRFDLSDAIRTFHQLVYPLFLAIADDQELAQVAAAAAAEPGDDGSFARLSRYGTESHRAWLQANEARCGLQAAFATLFETFDVLLMPVNPVTAIPHDHSEPMPSRTIQVNGRPRPYLDLIGWVGPMSACGLPVTAAPVGRTDSGLPVGIQIVGPRFGDLATIDFAEQSQPIWGGFSSPPV